MGGIIGYVGEREAKPLLLQGLSRLEYRGYDSAGIALREDDALDYVRAVGNLDMLKAAGGAKRSPFASRPAPNGPFPPPASAPRRWPPHGPVTDPTPPPLPGARTSASRSCSTESSR